MHLRKGNKGGEESKLGEMRFELQMMHAIMDLNWLQNNTTSKAEGTLIMNLMSEV